MASPSAEILVATTWDCNLACSYCFVRRGGLSAGRQYMDAAMATRVIDALDEGLTDVGSICVHLYGGEPLLNLAAMEAMVGRAARKPHGRFRFAITTNGTCGSEEAIGLLRAGSFQVVLSIDGPAEMHDACRRTLSGAPTHQRVMAFLHALRSRTDCWVRGSAVVRSGWSLSQASDYLRTLPVDAIKAQAVRVPLGAPHGLSPSEKEAYIQDLEAAGRRVIADLEAGQTPLDDRFSSRVLQLLTGRQRESFCGAGCTVFGIAPSGHVLPCVLIEQHGNALGHVNDDPKGWVEAGHRWRAARVARPECATCSSFDLCGGGCPAILPVCGADECDLVRANCAVARTIHAHFRAAPEMLLTLGGIP